MLRHTQVEEFCIENTKLLSPTGSLVKKMMMDNSTTFMTSNKLVYASLSGSDILNIDEKIIVPKRSSTAPLSALVCMSAFRSLQEVANPSLKAV